MSSLMDLNDRLFRELDRLEEVDMSDEAAREAEFERANTIGGMAARIVDNARTVMRAEQMRRESMTSTGELVVVPRLLMDESAPTCAERAEAAR